MKSDRVIVYEAGLAKGDTGYKIRHMKITTLALISLLATSATSFSASLVEPELNTCSISKGITKCEVRCIRSLGKQCLITHVNFEGKNLKPETELWRARFQTCKNANIDLQIKQLTLALEDTGKLDGMGQIKTSVKASGKTMSTRTDRSQVFTSGQQEGYLTRIPFEDFLSSGESHVDVSLKITQCGRRDGSNTCSISGKFVAVTDPNVRCDFHDTTQSGAFRPPSLQISPNMQNSQLPVGRIGQ